MIQAKLTINREHMYMSKRSNLYLNVVLSVFLLTLLGCGGSDNKPISNSAAEPISDDASGMLKGVFVDSPVTGLGYSTSSGFIGKTNLAGEFEYVAGDTITFLLGEIVLGEVLGGAKITPFDLVGFELPGEDVSIGDFIGSLALAETTNSATAFERGLNLLILLQSLDVNNDAGDGIEIGEAVFEFFTTLTAALSLDAKTDDFFGQFLDIFKLLIADGLLLRGPADNPISREAALEHFVLNN